MALKFEGGASTNKITDELGNILFEFNATTGELVNGQFLGVGQSWQEAELTDTGATFSDGTPSYRAPGVTYTNDTGKVISVVVNTNSANAVYTLMVDGVGVNRVDLETGVTSSLVITVPSGSTYSYSGVLNSWSELR